MSSLVYTEYTNPGVSTNPGPQHLRQAAYGLAIFLGRSGCILLRSEIGMDPDLEIVRPAVATGVE